jgi:hypothetical protein
MINETKGQLANEDPDLSAFSEALESGMVVVADLERALENLDTVLLTGRPYAIADATKAMELSLSTAEPALHRIVVTLETVGVARLQDAAQQLRRWDHTAAAATVEALLKALKRFAKRNDSCHRRAQGLGRGLTASLRTLHALGVTGNGRLIAEA